MKRHGPMPQFTIRHILAVTLALGALLALLRFLGPQGSLVLGSLTFMATPTIAFLAACFPDNCAMKKRAMIAAGISVFSLISMGTVQIVLNDPHLLPVLLLGTLCVWGGQWTFLAVLYAAWKSGMNTARLAEDSLRSNQPRNPSSLRHRR